MNQRTIDQNGTEIVAAWLRSRQGYDAAPDAVWEAHVNLQNGNVCDDESCPICFVYCELCGTHFDYDDRCRIH
jgi:hypothetical protein